MKHFVGFMTVLMVICLNVGISTGNTIEKAAGKNSSLEMVWETPKGLSVPESVMYDANAHVLYVSNISGTPTLKNGKGFIARVNLDGTIQELAWVGGLNAPKGMGILGDTLYVTDIDRVLAIDLSSARVTQTWEVEGAKFLNDIAVDPSGRVFITDMATKTIHLIQAGQLTSFLVLDYNKPNGLFMEGDILWVGTAEGLLKMDTLSKTTALEIEHKGGIDGLKLLGEGRFIVSDWKGKIQIIEKGQIPVVLMDTSARKINAADFEYIPGEKLVIVPTFFDNRIVAYQLR